MGVYILSNGSPYWNSLKKAIVNAFGQKPNNVDGRMAERTFFYESQLLNIVKGLFNVKCPDEWDIDYLLDNLIMSGKFCVTDTTMGVIPLRCAPYGHNVFDRPCDVNIANPVLGSFTRKIDVDCVVFYLYDNKHYRSMSELINIYATKLALCDSSIDVNLMNTKVAYLFDCADKKQSDEAKLIYDKIARGEPAVFYRSNTAVDGTNSRMQFFTTHVKEQYIVDKIQDEKRTIMNEFLTAIGINNVTTEKKERLISDEVNANNEELDYSIKYVRENIQKCLKKCKEMFPNLDFTISITLPKTVQQLNSGEGGTDNEHDRHSGDMGTEKKEE